VVAVSLTVRFKAENMTKPEIAQHMFIAPVFPLVTGIILAMIAARLSYSHFHSNQVAEVVVKA
jgi:hypothetical protein